MKKTICLLVLLMSLATTSFEQNQKKDSLPVYVQHPAIPSFSLLTTDSISFSDANLPKNRPVVIIYFSPECSHCQAEAKLIVQHIDSLKNAVFVWASYHPMNQIKEFAKTCGLDKFDNMILGRDLKYFIPAYYTVTQTPFMAIYNREAQFIKEFREGAKSEELIPLLK